MISEWLNVHMNILEKWISRKYFGFEKITSNASYSETLASILVISLPIKGLVNSFVSVTGLEKLDNLLNKVKERALVVLNHIFKYLFEKVPNNVKRKSPFLPRAIQFAPYLSQNLIGVCQRQDLIRLLDDDNFSELLVEATETLVIFSGEQEFQEALVHQSKDLVVYVALTLMRTSQQEI